MIQDDGTLRRLEREEEVLEVMAQTGRRRLFEKGEVVRIEGKDGEYKVDGLGSRFVRLRLLPLAPMGDAPQRRGVRREET